MNKNLLFFYLIVILTLPNSIFGAFKVLSENPQIPKTIQVSYSWEEIHKKAKNSVVQIFSYHQFFDWEKPYQHPKEMSSMGSGFFINSQGHVLTNYHVIEQAAVIQIQIPSLGKERFEAEVIGCYPDKDFAIIRLTEKSFNKLLTELRETINFAEIPFLTLGSSDEIFESQEVMCLGYPLGQQNLKSSIGNIAGYQTLEGQTFIQTTAAINHGNSGGPFLNSKGEVIGITDCIAPDAQNIGYFIPISAIKMSIEGFLEDRYKTKLLRRPSWGASFQPTTEDTLNFMGCPNNGGIRVTNVFRNSFAEKLGLQKGDILYKIIIKDKEIKIDKYGDVNVDWSETKIPISELLARLDIGEKFSVSIFRKNENNKITELKLDSKIDLGTSGSIYKKYPEFEKINYKIVGGMVIMELSENHLDILKQDIKDGVKKYGVLYLPNALKYDKLKNQNNPKLIISHIFSGTEITDARCFGIGEILEQINDKKVFTLEDLTQAIAVSEETGYLTIQTEDGAFAAIPYKKIREDENWLAKQFNLSDLQTTDSDKFEPVD